MHTGWGSTGRELIGRGVLSARRYELLAIIGHGATGIVHVARDRRRHTYVAVKVLRPVGHDELARLRFLAEPRLELDHPNVLRALDWYQTPNDAAIVLELCDSGSVAELMERNGTLDAEIVRSVAGDLVRGLAYLHERRIVHRDVKPANVLLTHDCDRLIAKLADFGLAVEDGRPRLTQTDVVVGTIDFVAPEVAAGADHTTASDVWSAGRVVTELLQRCDEPPDDLVRLAAAMTLDDPGRRPGARDAVRLLAATPDGGDPSTRTLDAARGAVTPVERTATTAPVRRVPSLSTSAQDACRRHRARERRRRVAMAMSAVTVVVSVVTTVAFAQRRDRPVSSALASSDSPQVSTPRSPVVRAHRPAAVSTHARVAAVVTPTPTRPLPRELAQPCGYYRAATGWFRSSSEQLRGNFALGARAWDVFGPGLGYLVLGDEINQMMGAAKVAGLNDLVARVGAADESLIELEMVQWLATAGDGSRATDDVLRAARPIIEIAAAERGEPAALLDRFDAIAQIDEWFAANGCVSRWRDTAELRDRSAATLLRAPVRSSAEFFARIDEIAEVF